MSEEELLTQLLPYTSPGGPGLLIGPGDDAALLSATDGRVVLCSDVLVQNRDFRLCWPSGHRTRGSEVGWKAAAANLSDIAAMGAAPSGLLVSLVLPEDTPVSWVEDLMRGIGQACQKLGALDCPVAGGDLSAGGHLSVSITAVGDLQGRDPVLRSGAKPGHIVAVAGELGRAAAGWALLERSQPLDTLEVEQRSLVTSFLTPTPPLPAGLRAATVPAGAMMDISDGLLRDAHRLAQSSGVHVELDRSQLALFIPPLEATARAVGADPWEWVLTGGEDYALLSTFSRACWPVPGFRAIGWIGSEGQTDGAVQINGQPEGKRGWDHFAGTSRSDAYRPQ